MENMIKRMKHSMENVTKLYYDLILKEFIITDKNDMKFNVMKGNTKISVSYPVDYGDVIETVEYNDDDELDFNTMCNFDDIEDFYGYLNK